MYDTPQTRLLKLQKTRGDHAIFHQPVDRTWNPYTRADAVGQARAMAAALADLGLRKGDRVAIFSKNCAHRFMADFATMLGGFVSVPIYPTANVDGETGGFLARREGFEGREKLRDLGLGGNDEEGVVDQPVPVGVRRPVRGGRRRLRAGRGPHPDWLERIR